MKIIELLNKIANGEEVPKKIKYKDIIFNFCCDEYDSEYYAEDDSDIFSNMYASANDLNKEIEIIEDNKIEKLSMVYNGNAEDEIMRNRYKINEIIDKINEMSDK